MLSKKLKKGSGQGLVEYALILVLVAIVAIASLMILGPMIQKVTDSAKNDAAATAAPDINKIALSDAPFIRERSISLI
jgi:Flp pilus assembly pilin Flp